MTFKSFSKFFGDDWAYLLHSANRRLGFTYGSTILVMYFNHGPLLFVYDNQAAFHWSLNQVPNESKGFVNQ